jgi:hypothetical protein
VKYGLVLAEGDTEAEFINSVLNPHLNAKGLHLTPKLATTKRAGKGRPVYKGGVVSYGKVEFDLRQLLKDRNAVVITTMIDFYGLAGKDFPGAETLPLTTCYAKVAHLEHELSQRMRDARFLSYLALHEFEAMLLCFPAAFARIFPDLEANVIEALSKVSEAFSSPEEIDLDQPPSMRIHALVREYTKGVAGALIALEIGLPKIRAACPHFDQWVAKLEAIAEQP